MQGAPASSKARPEGDTQSNSGTSSHELIQRSQTLDPFGPVATPTPPIHPTTHARAGCRPAGAAPFARVMLPCPALKTASPVLTTPGEPHLAHPREPGGPCPDAHMRAGADKTTLSLPPLTLSLDGRPRPGKSTAALARRPWVEGAREGSRPGPQPPPTPGANGRRDRPAPHSMPAACGTQCARWVGEVLERNPMIHVCSSLHALRKARPFVFCGCLWPHRAYI